MRDILAVDIGGSSIKYARFREDLKEVREVETPHDSLDSLIDIIFKLAEENNAQALALSMPGFIDPDLGIAHTGGALNYIDETEIRKILEKRLGIPVSVENDAKAAALAEMRGGVLVGIKNAVVLIFGTGVGGAVIVDGKILRGKNLLSGEFSFISADINKPEDVKLEVGALLGSAGLLDCVCRSSGITFKNGREVFREINNSAVMRGFENFTSRIVWFLYNLEVILNPECFAVGGGISRQPLLVETIRKTIEKESSEGIRQILPKPEVLSCHFKSDANLIGAVYNFLDRH